ncbi:MAG: NAD(P)/FAD-dependent oxidoreductase [Selenomonadaceae bacterium]|nr:NAD(P)/FAD-dependent oxidoreductase [Selenomonadaceae bacterium]
MSNGKPHIVIVGGGFGGIKIGQLFAKENVEVTLIDRHNFHLFQPLLYQVSTAVLETGEVAYPIRSFFRNNRNVNLFMAKVQGVDQERDVVITNHGEIHYDYLILAAGATTNFFGMKSVEEHSFGMKTLQEAVHIRNHVIHEFERAEKPYRTPEDRKKRMTFVIVGGGPTGVEEAGAIAELISIQKKEFHLLDFNDVSIKLIEATPRLLPMLPEDLQEHTVKVLQKKGVEVMLNTQVVDYDGDILTLKNGVKIPTTTVIWAAGVRAVDMMKNCGGECARDGRIWIEEDLMVRGAVHKNVFAIGDCAAFMHGDMKRPLPTVAPVATQQAKVAYKNIMKLIKGDTNLDKFVYKDLGAMATIGKGEAVVGSPKMTGFFAWCAWMVVHLIRLAGFYTNMTVAFKWALNFLTSARLGRIVTNISLDPDK